MNQEKIVELVQKFLAKYEKSQVHDYYVQCDERNNSPEDIARNVINVDVYFKLEKEAPYQLEQLQMPNED